MYQYQGVITRFLRSEERLILSKENEMPLVIEADGTRDLAFLKNLLAQNSTQIIKDMAQYGAILLRGFNIENEAEFEQAVLSVPQFHGIRDAFMSEYGRDHVKDQQFVLHTNAIYKTGGTLHLGSFHTENYYTTDVPNYVCFFCLRPSLLGGETGLINAEKVYTHLPDDVKEKLEKTSFFVEQWRVSDIIARYSIDSSQVKEICQHFDLPIYEGDNPFVCMYKPSVLEHPLTQKKALQLHLYELPNLGAEVRKCFINDYKGKDWFWHRFYWKLPQPISSAYDFLSAFLVGFFYSPKNFHKTSPRRYGKFKLHNTNSLSSVDRKRVGSCFKKQDIQDLAGLMRDYYSSCLWKKGDILLIDNKKVMHSGMPGKGPRLLRAMLCNPIKMHYSPKTPGCIVAKEEQTPSVGACMAAGKINLV